MSEFGSECERRKLRVNVGKSKDMRCSRQENGGRMFLILNCEAWQRSELFEVTGAASVSGWRM